MTAGTHYQIVPLEGGEHSNKVESILKKKYENTTKRVTLNERFGVLEKGYMLHAAEPTEQDKVTNVFLVVHDKNLISKKEFIGNYLAKNPIVEPSKNDEVEEDKENGPTKKQTTVTVAKKEFTTEDYVRDITRSILKAI